MARAMTVNVILQNFSLGEIPAGMTTPCKLWKGELDRDGYGRCSYKGVRQQAHKFVWRWTKMEEIPEGIELDHKCRIRRCINVDHLEKVTKAENLNRRVFGASRE